jgi:hypothetical protein
LFSLGHDRAGIVQRAGTMLSKCAQQLPHRESEFGKAYPAAVIQELLRPAPARLPSSVDRQVPSGVARPRRPIAAHGVGP